ncbi:M56 family metallopeptidase [Winogradskyella poriferorum]|uniref:M56 family metallopeptidase n=1 Tax=Winogradskyella poriferorum TaxID=307627 RepID=UPI003D64D7A7
MEYLLKSTIVLTVFYICYFFFLRKETFFTHNRWYLLSGLVIALVFPLIIIPIHISVEPKTVNPQLFSYIEEIPLNSETASTSFDWSQLILGVYLTGLILFLIQFVFQFGSLIWLLLTNPKNKDGFYTYVIVNSKIAPFSFFKWIVYNPDSFNNKELDLMLTHEKVHASQLHSLDILFTQLVCSIFWFNPLMWLYRNDIRQNLEYIADHKTQSNTNSTKEYQHLLLKTSVGEQQISLSNNFYNSLIKERIVMLQKSRSNNMKQWRYLLMLPVIAGLLMSMNTKTIYTTNAPEEIVSATPLSNEIGGHIEIIFNKDTTEEQLNTIKSDLKKNGVTMTIKNIKRNDANEITQINVDFKTENGSANYNISSDEAIKPFKFSMKEDGSFGVGPTAHEEIIIVEGVSPEPRVRKESNIFYFKEGEDGEIIEIEEDSSNVYEFRVKGGNSFYFKEDDGKNLHKNHDVDKDVHVIKEYIIDSVDSKKIIKIKTDNFYEEDSKIEIRTGGDQVKILTPGKVTSKTVVGYRNNSQEPLIIVDGEVISNDKMGKINPNDIDSVNVLKGESAVTIYGQDGKNGVVVVKTKDGDSKGINIKGDKLTWTTKDNQEGPWKVTTGVSGYTFISDDDLSKNATIGIITKDTPDSVLDANKASLEDLGISVKYSKLRRNKAGKITSIKISLKNNSGKQSSASYKNDDGISEIEYGVMGDKLIVRSRN